MSKFPLDPRRCLGIPLFYEFYQAIVGATSARKKVIQSRMILFDGARILEIGCGTGTNLDYLPRTVEYVGCDISEKYIRYAQSKYDGRATFIKAGAGELAAKNLGFFDFVLSIGLLHHLSDSENQILCREVLGLLNEKGCFIAIESCHSEEQSPLEKWLNSKDRGQYIRFPKDYVRLLSNSFSKIETEYFKEGRFISHSGVFIKAHKT